MSKEKAREFADRVDKEKALQKKIRAATKDVMKVAKEYGYHFTRNELHDALREKWETAKLPPSNEAAIAVFFTGRPSF